MRKVLARKVLGGRSHFFGEKSTCGEGFGREKPLLREKSTCGEGFVREKTLLWEEKCLRGRFGEGESTSLGMKVLAGKVLG